MKVFHFILDHRVGGPHVYVGSVAQMLSPEVVSTIVTTGRGDVTDLALTNLRHRFRALYPIEVFYNVLRLCWIFRKKQSRSLAVFDVHGAANIAPVFAARLLGIPLVWHFHETLATFGALVKLGMTAISGKAHRFVVVAKKSARVFNLPDATLIPGAVDADFWHITDSEKQSRELSNKLRLVAVGNLNPLKGFDLLLDALSGLNTPWELVIVGAELQTFSEHASALRDKAAQLTRHDSRVKFAGWQSATSVKELLAAANVFVLPSRSEACPIALLEAMSMECACVATNVGDVEEILCDPDTGIVSATASSEHLLSALKKAASLGAEGRQRMGASARERIVTHYSQMMMAQRHLDIYRELLQEA